MGIAHDYLDAVLRRGRTEMPPVGFRPDWADKPRAGKYYPGTTPLPLPHGDDPPAATLDAGLAPPPPGGGAPFGLDALAGMLLDSYGRLSRRLALHANDDVAALPHYTGASWARGTASGGGLYPVSIYWVNGPGTALLPGVHYYDTAQHAFRRLLAGDVTGHVREALGPRTPPDDDPGQQFLVLGIKFWQNAFKYNSFCYHATAMDVGTLTQTWRMWARARGMAVRPVFWFDERRLARLLGIDPADEAVAAVVPLRTGPATRPSPATGTPRVRLADRERSRRVRTFAAVREMQAAALAGASSRPAPDALAPAAPRPVVADRRAAVVLPAPAPLTATVRGALRARRSSFGRFTSALPLRQDQLAAVLKAAAAGAALPCDAGGPPGVDLARSYVFVNHVTGLEPGAYVHVPEAGALVRVLAGPHGSFLQENYFLRNYNPEQAGAVIVTTLRATALLDAAGDRGYRLAGAVVGAAAQALYTACAALGIGCGAALGFDNVSFAERLRLTPAGESPLLITMVGNELRGPAGYRYELA